MEFDFEFTDKSLLTSKPINDLGVLTAPQVFLKVSAAKNTIY